MVYNTDELLQFLQSSPSPFHAARNCAKTLEHHGFKQLYEKDNWSGIHQGNYYVLRNNSSLIAFTTNGTPLEKTGLRMAGAHTDSPGLKVKPKPEITNSGWQQLGVEVYGGALLAPWFDRNLSLAGRIITESQKGDRKELLIDFTDPIAVIPSLAIHFDREANKNKSINKQTDIVPILGLIDGEEKNGSSPKRVPVSMKIIET